MNEKFIIANSKKYLENMNTKEDIINFKKDKILSLRKKKNKKVNFHRILKEKLIEESKKYSIYEFDESDFKNVKEKYINEKEKDKFKFSFEHIYKSNPYDNEELKYWLYFINQKSMRGKNDDIDEILKNLSNEKVKFLIDILVDSSQFNNLNNNSNNFEQIKNFIKFKYTICSILINLLYDTEKYNDIFIEKMMLIYNFILTLIQIYNKWNDNSFIILISEYQCLINNCIILDYVYSKILKNHPTINFPQLIQVIFKINHIELYISNIRMLIHFLNNQSNVESFFQYNSFISDLENIILVAINNNKIQILLEAYNALKILFKSAANCKYVIENGKFVKLIDKIINGFNNISLCNCCLTRLIKGDSDNIINGNYQLHKTLIDIIFKKIVAGKDTIKHSLKMLRLIFNNKNGYNIINILINTYSNNFFVQLQQLYFEKPYDLLIQSEIFNFLDNIFELTNNSFKSMLISNDLHKFVLNCLESCYQEFITDNKDNKCYNKLIVQMLTLLVSILKFGESELNMKISLKDYCEEKNIYHILQELNYSKNKKIQDLVETLNQNYFDGYENEEFNDDEDREPLF